MSDSPSFFRATVSSLLGRKPFIKYELPCQVSHGLGNEMALSLLPSIDGEGLFDIWPAAGADNAGEFVDIKGNMTKGDAQACSFGGDDSIICPGVYSHAPMRRVGKLPVIGQADASRIDIPGGAQASHLLRVGMPTGEQPGIGVAHHDRAVQFAQPCKSLGRL